MMMIMNIMANKCIEMYTALFKYFNMIGSELPPEKIEKRYKYDNTEFSLSFLSNL